MTATIGRFAGHLKEFGPVPPDPFRRLHARVLGSEHGWPATGGPAFSQEIKGLDNIALMFPTDYPRSHLNSAPTAHWPAWQNCVTPLIAFLGNQLSPRTYLPAKVLLSRLRAGETIAEHIDLNPASQVPHKLHIPIATSPEVVFTVEDAEYRLKPGCAYELNNLRRHAVYNRGPVDRIHLIIELYPVELRR